jgi:hypothetical protein
LILVGLGFSLHLLNSSGTKLLAAISECALLDTDIRRKLLHAFFVTALVQNVLSTLRISAWLVTQGGCSRTINAPR